MLFASVPALAFQVSPLSQEPETTLDPPGLRLVELSDGAMRDWLYFLDGRVVREPSLDATPIYIPPWEADPALTPAGGRD
jgi:hypothetical protein